METARRVMMKEFLEKLFSSDYMPHGYCYLWKPDIVWLHAVSDGLIMFSYYVIPVLLIYFVLKRRDLPFHWMFVMFGVFIFGCGTTHLMEIWTLWHGTYRLSGVVKAITAGASLATAAALFPMIPKALAIPSPEALRLEIEQRKWVEAELRRTGMIRQSLAARLITVQEEERKRIARDLHDDLSQRLALHCVDLDVLCQSLPPGSETAREVGRLLSDAQGLTLQVRQISHDLHHPQLVLGLEHCVASFCREFSEQHAIEVEFTHEGNLKQIPETASVVLGRVLQEALANIVKHSGADRGSVVITVEDHQALMRVADRGQGFDTASAESKGGLGLISMRERLRLVGGAMSVVTSPGQGTSVEVMVPMMVRSKTTSASA
jgi:signal transduction histidine kinase